MGWLRMWLTIFKIYFVGCRKLIFFFWLRHKEIIHKNQSILTYILAAHPLRSNSISLSLKISVVCHDNDHYISLTFE